MEHMLGCVRKVRIFIEGECSICRTFMATSVTVPASEMKDHPSMAYENTLAALEVVMDDYAWTTEPGSEVVCSRCIDKLHEKRRKKRAAAHPITPFLL